MFIPNLLRRTAASTQTARRALLRAPSSTASHSTRTYAALTGALLIATAGVSAFVSSSHIELDSKVGERLESVQVDRSVDPIPMRVKFTTSYELLGFGTRSVTFLGFKVYALGLYVASQDIPNISTVLDSKYLSTAFVDTDPTKSHAENVLAALQDPKKSPILISNLLDSNIRLVARISPLRNTDFTHLKDGLVKSILAAKSKDETLDAGLQELKDAFIRRGSVPKNHNLIIERLGGGQLQLYYQNTTNGDFVELGRVETPLISKLLFSQYLSGGLSPSTKESCIQRISQMV